MATNVKVKRTKLPGKLSAMIRLACEDLKKSEAGRGMVVDMGTWCDFHPKYKSCTHCFGGAVMAHSLGVAETCAPWELNISEKDQEKIQALDAIRTGDVEGAFYIFYAGVELPKGLDATVEVMPYPLPGVDGEDIGTPEYNRKVRAFHRDMEKLAKRLEKAGY